MKTTIISFGTMYLDIISTHFPIHDGFKPETEVVGKDYHVSPGGSALIFARVTHALGLTPIFIGKRGEDTLGEVLEELVRTEGITPAFISSPTVQTNIGVNYVSETGISIQTAIGSANQSLASHEVEEKLQTVLSSASYLYLGGCFKLKSILPDLPPIISLAKKRNLTLVLDHNRVNNTVTPEEKKIMRECISQVDFYFPSNDEFCTLWEVETITEGLQKLHQTLKTIVVVKDAEKGAYSMQNGEIIHVPAFTVRMRSSVGAGDSFNAGFVKAQTLGLDLKQSMRFGCATAALKISGEHLPTEQQVFDFLQNHD